MSYYFNRLRKKPNYSRARNELSASVFTISMGSSSRVCCRGWVVKGGNPGRNIRVRLCLFDHVRRNRRPAKRYRRHRLRPGRPRPSANRLGQAARPARRRGDREQEVVELNSRTLTDGHCNCYRNPEPFTHEQRACAIQQLLDTATRTALLSIYPDEFPSRIWRDRLG